MNAKKSMKETLSIEGEDMWLADLWRQCERFLQEHHAYGYTHEDGPTDAFVAIFTLQAEIVARRSYILGLYQQEELPF